MGCLEREIGFQDGSRRHSEGTMSSLHCLVITMYYSWKMKHACMKKFENILFRNLKILRNIGK